jgi:hypothetical protein
MKFKILSSKFKVLSQKFQCSLIGWQTPAGFFHQIENKTAGVFLLSNQTLTGLGFINISPASLLPIFHPTEYEGNIAQMAVGAH